MKKIFNILNIYLFLAALFMLQDVVYEGGTTLSKVIIVAFALMSILYTLYANVHYKLPLYFKGLNILLILFSLYGIWHIGVSSIDYVRSNNGEVASYMYLLSIYMSLLPIYAFYVATIEGQLNLSKIQNIGILFIILSAIKFFAYQTNATDIDEVTSITNNHGYLFVSFIPLLFYYKDKPILQYLFFMFCLSMVILSMKRGAMLTASLCAILFLTSMWMQGQKNTRLKLSIIIIIVFWGGLYFIQHLLTTSEYFVNRVQSTLDGNTSLRDVLLRDMWNYFYNKASLTTQLFGGGANFTLQVADNYAHNDWMEILINQGILGVFIYVIYWITFYKTYKTSKIDYDLRTESSALLNVFVACFVMTFFSMSYSNMQICMTMALGISLGRISQHNTQS